MDLNNRWLRVATLVVIATLQSTQVFADDLNAANTSWILTSTALVLFMTIP
ncbi:MAG: ammonium transporter, partial [Porticoccaceae bacterium]|nr:ammonium transporter [Porticoccaceae bacterium]